MSEKDTKRQVRKEWKKASGIMADRASAISEMSFATGSLIGPIVGGRLTDKHGY